MNASHSCENLHFLLAFGHLHPLFDALVSDKSVSGKLFVICRDEQLLIMYGNTLWCPVHSFVVIVIVMI